MKTVFSKHFLGDLLFFIAVIALPSSFFNFIDHSVFFDLRLVFMLVGVGYLLLYFKHLPKITQLKGGWLLILVCGYIGFKLLHSILIQGIPWVEVATIFRSNFFYPIATLGFLLYVSKMDNQRLYRFGQWLFTVTFILGVLFIISNLTGINFYANQPKDFDEFQGVTIMRNFLALPDYNTFLYAFALLAGLTAYSFKKHWLWGIPLIVTILSVTRNQIIVYALIFCCLFIFGMLSKIKIRLNRIISTVLLLVIFVVAVQLVFPTYMGRVIDRFGLEERTQFRLQDYTEYGTYAFRLSLIEDSYVRTKRNSNLLFGNGYKREATKGDYDFVVGDDTKIAPVLWAEGFVGLFIRMLPIIYFLFLGFKYMRSSDYASAFFSLIFISLILSELVNIVQTKIFTDYHHHIFVFYLMLMLLYNRRN